MLSPTRDNGAAPGSTVQQRAHPSLQTKGAGGMESIHAAAERGTSGGGGALPHLGRIQSSFGAHDVSNVQSYAGGAAADASKAMGADAYATGSKVAFRGAPDLHTAAHEAAHVVQQRAGVSLEGGVGKAGDRYEQHADHVASAVVGGKSAEPILDRMTGGSSSRSLQKKEAGAGGGLAAQLGITQEQLEAFAREQGLEGALGAAATAGPVQMKMSSAGPLPSMNAYANPIANSPVQLMGAGGGSPVQFKKQPTKADAQSITLPTGHTLGGWKATAIKVLLATTPGGGGLILLAAMQTANAMGCTIGIGVGISGGAAAGFGGGIMGGVGVLAAPGNRIGVYGSGGAMGGMLMKISASAQVTIIKGGVENFGGPALAVGGSFYAKFGGGACALFKLTGEFLGVTVEGGVGVGYSLYAGASYTATLGG